MHLNAFGRSGFALLSSLRAGLVLSALALTSLASAQVVISETYSVPAYVDGSAHSVFFDLSPQLSWTSAPITSATLTIDFGKTADLWDDPPFYSELGLVLRKYDPTFSFVDEITLIELGSFFDGPAGASFDGTITFDDSATEYVNADPDNLSPGIFKPVQPLLWLTGDYSPYWELRVVDAGLQNPVFFNSATLSIAVPVPESSTLGIGAAVALGTVILLRRKMRT